MFPVFVPSGRAPRRVPVAPASRPTAALPLAFGLAALAASVLSCSTPGDTNLIDTVTADTAPDERSTAEVVLPTGDDIAPDADAVALEETQPYDAPPQCEPGQGCAGDPCTTNEQCQAGWCVEHIGEGVCTNACQEECPAGWTCSKVAGTGPDVVYICVSQYANLCKPCASSADCGSIGGADDLCLDYGEEGSFCGGTCKEESDCPWGFSCSQAATVDGIPVTQCVSQTGTCPCTEKSAAMALWTPCGVTNESGTCTGKRVCAAEGLSPCSAPNPAPESCNGTDDDCDGDTDELLDEQGGALVGICDDGNDCTTDVCKAADGCQHTAIESGECKDGNPCTAADHCEAGVCIGTPVLCNDGNPCTQDLCTANGGCDFVPQDIECDDGDPCTVADRCDDAAACTGVPVSCDCTDDADCTGLDDSDACNGTLLCDLTGFPFKCTVDPATVVVCPPPLGPDAPCIEASCDPTSGKCSVVPANDGAPCDDGDLCFLGDHCAQGSCQPGQPVNCNDGNPCTDDSCTPDVGCTHAANSLPCEDGNPCTLPGTCAQGACESGPPMACDDANGCTDDTCDPSSGCKHTPNALPCSDGNACTEGDHCQASGCVSGNLVNCDDKNVCTDDACDPATGCTYALNKAPCSDGNPATLNDVCLNGACQPGAVLGCDDGNECTDDTQAPDGSCKHTPVAKPCNDNNECTSGDVCANGKCSYSSIVTCDDKSVCTTDTCDPLAGCVYSLNSAPCDDGDVCTTGDHCHLGACISSGKMTCLDGNPCTDDSCAPGAGCQFAPISAACDDANACTTADHCAAGACSGTPVTCDDKNLCTDDSCNPATGCAATFNKTPCDDGDPCTTGDVCKDGKCTPGTAPGCDDKNVCTDDSCGPNGCFHVPNAAACDDANACTTGDTCAAGKCVGGSPPVCDDKNVCTTDSCDPAKGCLFTNNTAACEDGSACTKSDQCKDGKCLAGPTVVCNDNVPCTVDTCDPASGCKFLPGDCCGNSTIEAGESCDDGNKLPGDGCNEQCQYENLTMPLGITADDFDVAHDGSLVAVGRESFAVVAECFGPDHKQLKPKFVVFSVPSGCVIEHVHVAMAGASRHFAVMIRHQTIAGDWASRRGTVRVFDSACNPVAAAVQFETGSMDEWRDIDMSDAGQATLAWLGAGQKLTVQAFGANGAAVQPAAQAPGGSCPDGVHVAVRGPTGEGVATCQGHAGDPLYFWLLNSNGSFKGTATQVQSSPPSSWYDSHVVGMNDAGAFVVEWAAGNDYKANLYDAAGAFKATLSVGKNTSGMSCFDPFRDYNVEIQAPSDNFVLPWNADGVCYSDPSHEYVRVSPTGTLLASVKETYNMQTLRMDSKANTYLLSANKIMMNSVKLQ